MEISEKLEKIIDKENIYLNESMKKHTSFKIGGNADVFVYIKTKEELINLLKFVNENDIKLTIIGNGTNLLVSDLGIRGITAKIDIKEIEFLNDTEVKVSCGIPNGKLSFDLQEKGLTGFEFASGIPGTIGGAIKQNAGAYYHEVKELIKEVKVIDRKTLEIKTLTNEECKFSYRRSIFHESNQYIIISCIMKFEKGNPEEIRDKINEYREFRMSSQPQDYPNAGSIFKRLEGFMTAKAIDDLGLKGYRVGGAEVSTKHAGFIVNVGDATCKDVLDLIDYIKTRVKEEYGKEIETEIELIGE